VTQAEMQMVDIAALCGFGRAEQFSRAYFIRFDIAPTRDRIEGRIPFQFNNLIDRSAYHSVD
jgi:transcriptional regulator GlxA family with amidase domain